MTTTVERDLAKARKELISLANKMQTHITRAVSDMEIEKTVQEIIRLKEKAQDSQTAHEALQTLKIGLGKASRTLASWEIKVDRTLASSTRKTAKAKKSPRPRVRVKPRTTKKATSIVKNAVAKD